MTNKEMDEQVLRIWREVPCGRGFNADVYILDFARRLRAEWMAQQEPVALCLRANSDGSYGEPVVFTRYAMFAENLAKAQKHQWIIHGAGKLVPLYAIPLKDDNHV